MTQRPSNAQSPELHGRPVCSEIAVIANQNLITSSQAFNCHLRHCQTLPIKASSQAWPAANT